MNDGSSGRESSSSYFVFDHSTAKAIRTSSATRRGVAMQTGPALITSLTADKLRRGAERPKMGKPDWRQLVRQFPHISGTIQLLLPEVNCIMKPTISFI